MTRALGVAVVATAALAGSAAAQQNWLLGTWLTSQMDPRGITNSAVAARFEPTGRLIIQIAVSGSGGSGTQTYVATWRMTGPQSYVSQIVDYEPKQMCGAMGCVPVPPTIPMGTTENCSFQPLNQIAMTVSCNGQAPVRFTRQN
jgi:hypothetical protein